MERKVMFNGYDLSAIEESTKSAIVHALHGDNIALKELIHEDQRLVNSTLGIFYSYPFCSQVRAYRHSQTIIGAWSRYNKEPYWMVR